MTSVINAMDEETELSPERMAQEKRKEKLKVDLHLEAEDLRTVLSTRAGRNVIAKILRRAPPLDRTAVSSGSWTYFNEGARSICSEILKDILENAPEAYFQMKDEEKEN